MPDAALGEQLLEIVRATGPDVVLVQNEHLALAVGNHAIALNRSLKERTGQGHFRRGRCWCMGGRVAAARAQQRATCGDSGQEDHS
jgi:hypothetical protein